MKHEREINIDVVRERLARLREQADDLLRSRYKSAISHQEFVDSSMFREWRIGCIAFLREALGDDSPYATEFESSCDSPFLTAMARGYAILRAVREYIDVGPVARVEELVAAEIFGDLLAIARRMIENGNVAAAVVAAGAVLEDVMRRKARLRRIAIKENVDDIADINRKLAQAGAYPAAVEKRIEQWAGLVAEGARGPVDSGAAGAVGAMITGVRNFVNDYLV